MGVSPRLVPRGTLTPGQVAAFYLAAQAGTNRPLVLGVREAARDASSHVVTPSLEKLLIKVAYSSAKLNLQYQ